MKERLRWRAALLEGFAVLDSLRTWVAESEHYLNHVAGPDATPTYDEVREMVWRTGPARTTPLPRAAVDDLVSSGGFQLIRSAEVRRALAAYARSLDRDDEEQSDVREFFNTMVYPYHVHEGSFSEFPWEDYVELPESPVSFPLDVDRFARNRTYANLLISRMSSTATSGTRTEMSSVGSMRPWRLSRGRSRNGLPAVTPPGSRFACSRATMAAVRPRTRRQRLRAGGTDSMCDTGLRRGVIAVLAATLLGIPGPATAQNHPRPTEGWARGTPAAVGLSESALDDTAFPPLRPRGVA